LPDLRCLPLKSHAEIIALSIRGGAARFNSIRTATMAAQTFGTYVSTDTPGFSKKDARPVCGA